MMRTTVSSRGQTAVPSEVRKRFNLTENSRLEWIIEGDVITVLPVLPDPIPSAVRRAASTPALCCCGSGGASGPVAEPERYTLDTSAIIASSPTSRTKRAPTGSRAARRCGARTHRGLRVVHDLMSILNRPAGERHLRDDQPVVWP